MEKKFKIDFFEFSFLVEACIPPRPIARTCFFKEVSDVYYHQMTSDERVRLFEWITKSNSFDLNDEECSHFYSRFNPNNQFIVTTEFEGDIKEHECYMYNNEYRTKQNVFITRDVIKEVRYVSENTEV